MKALIRRSLKDTQETVRRESGCVTVTCCFVIFPGLRSDDLCVDDLFLYAVRMEQNDRYDERDDILQSPGLG